MRILFLGTPDYAVPFLQTLIDNGYTPIAVISQPDRPAGRSQAITPTPVKILAQEHGISVLQPENINTPEWLDRIADLKPDLMVIVAFGQILSQALLDIPTKGCINVHPSKLPKYRGASPLQETILHGDLESAVSIILMDEKMDHGPIILQESFAIDPRETTTTLIAKTTSLGQKLLIQAVRSIENNTAHFTPQDHSQTTFTKMMTREWGKINFTENALAIDRKVRALNPWPGTWIEWEGKRVKILAVHPVEPIEAPSSFFKYGDELAIRCGEGSLLVIDQLQIEGKSPISGSDFIRGYLTKS